MVPMEGVMHNLRPATLRVYNGIETHWAEEKRSPSLRELRARLGLTLNPLSYHLKILEKNGLIAPRRHGCHRDIYLTQSVGQAA